MIQKIVNIYIKIIYIRHYMNNILNIILPGKNIDKLTNYILIDKNNIEELEIGMHIKYKKENDNKIYNGGFLIKIIDLNKDKLVYTILILKSNIVWNMRFIKYKIYGKKICLFNHKKNIIQDIKIEFINDINKSKKIINDNLNYKLLLINNNKNKYKIIF